jgi:hypothetical protein
LLETVALTVPAACAGVVSSICALLTLVIAAGVPPSEAVHPTLKSSPFMVIVWPPAVTPDAGAHESTVGGTAYVKQAFRVEVCVSGLDTATPTRPAACAGVVSTSCVALKEVTAAGVPPTVAVQPEIKLEPLTVSAWPPAVEPLEGATDDTKGGPDAKYVNPAVRVPLCMSGFVTMTFFAPAVPAGVVPLTVAASTYTSPVTRLPPMEAVHPLTKYLPDMVIACPPTVRPDAGVIESTSGGGFTNVNPLNLTANCRSLLTTVTVTEPAPLAGVVTPSDEEFMKNTAVAVMFEKYTLQGFEKLEPFIVMYCPPRVVPEAGEQLLISGVGLLE